MSDTPTREQLVIEIERHEERINRAKRRHSAALARLREHDAEAETFRQREAAARLSDNDPVKAGNILLVTGYGKHLGRDVSMLVSVHAGLANRDRNIYNVGGDRLNWRQFRLNLIRQGFATIYVMVNNIPVPLFPRVPEGDDILRDVLVQPERQRVHARSMLPYQF